MIKLIEHTSNNVARIISDQYANTLECKAMNLQLLIDKSAMSAAEFLQLQYQRFRSN